MYRIVEMEKEHVDQISTWQYDAPYEIYSMEKCDDIYDEFLDGSAFAVLDQENKLFGYFCFGSNAQVPNDTKAYNDHGFIDIKQFS